MPQTNERNWYDKDRDRLRVVGFDSGSVILSIIPKGCHVDDGYQFLLNSKQKKELIGYLSD